MSHRRGRRTSFLTFSTGRRHATPLEIADVADDEQALELAGRSAVLQYRDATGEHVLDVSSGNSLDVTSLLEVRRPHSYPEMGNFTGKFPPPQGGDRAIWYESRNERTHYQDLVVSGKVNFIVAQPLQMRWRIGTGDLLHVVDCLCLTTSGGCRMVDVTTERKFQDTRARAKFQLSGVTARLMGWSYEVRTPMSNQRTVNLGHIHSYRRVATVDQRRLWMEAALELQYPQQLGVVARHLSVHDLPRGRAMVMHLLTNGLLFVDLESPLHDRTMLSLDPTREEQPWRQRL